MLTIPLAALIAASVGGVSCLLRGRLAAATAVFVITLVLCTLVIRIMQHIGVQPFQW